MKNFIIVYSIISIIMHVTLSLSENNLVINNENEGVLSSNICVEDVLMIKENNTPLTDARKSYLLKKDEQDVSQEIIEYINIYRKSIGLNSLISNTTAKVQALTHSETQALDKKISHERKDYRAFILFRTEEANSYGENVGFGYTDVEKLVKAWVKSEPHRKNIEGDFTYTGVGTIANNKGVLYYTQIFFK